MPDLVKALHSGRVLLMDGAMGTELFRAGVPRDACLEELNLTQPELVQRIHRAYVDAGAEVLLTHTFQVKPRESATLKRIFNSAAIYQKAIHAARSIGGPNRFVLFDHGPFDAQWRRYAEMIVDDFDLRDVDAILMETASEIDDTERLIHQQNNLAKNRRPPVLISWTFRHSEGGCIATHGSRSPEKCAKLTAELGLSALGVNCGRDIAMADILEIVRRYRSVTDLPLFVRPNAGTPKQMGGQWVYPETPESMAAWLPELFKAGVVMVGGCCGTTPAHIAAFRKVVNEWNSSQARSEPEF